MAEISAGIFFTFLSLGILSIFFSLRGGVFGTIFRLVSVILFFVISLILFGGYDVVINQTEFDGTWTNSTQYIIGNQYDSYATMSEPLAWVFLAIAIILSMLFLVDALRGYV